MNDHDELHDGQITRYRALVARANYLVVERGDIAFYVKELARCMSSPSRQDWERLQRLARYLRHNLGAYYGMHTKAQQAKSLASLTGTGSLKCSHFARIRKQDVVCSINKFARSPNGSQLATND